MTRQQHRSPAPSSSGAHCPRFNLFRHKLLDDLLCAVREDYPVPAFVNGDTWTFAGTVNEAAYGLVERNWSGAKDGVCVWASTSSNHVQFAKQFLAR